MQPRLFTLNDQTKTLSEWAELVGISSELMTYRIRKFGFDKAIFMSAPNHLPPITFNNETRTLKEWAEYLNVKTATLRYRLRRWSLEKTFSKPVRHYLKKEQQSCLGGGNAS